MIFTTTFQIFSIIRIDFSRCRMYCNMCRVRPEPYAIPLNRDKEPTEPISSHSNSSNSHNQTQFIYLSNHQLVQ